MSGLLIKGGRIVTAGGSYEADIHAADGVIQTIGRDLHFEGAELVRAEGCYVLPGAIDPHTHLAMPLAGYSSQDDYESGSVAAACGGVTSLIDFVDCRPGDSLNDAIQRKQDLARGKSALDYGLHGTITESRPELIAEIRRSCADYGVPSFKVYMVYDIGVDDLTILRVMDEAKAHGGLVQVHAENRAVIEHMNSVLAAKGKLSPRYHAQSRPNLCEAEAIQRMLRLAELTGARVYIVHLSTAEGLAEIKAARERGVKVYAETCPQYLVLNHERYEAQGFEGAKYICSPPLRGPRDNEALWAGLAAGDIQTLATDHCPFDFHGVKDRFGTGDYRVIPNGMPGIETLLPVVHSEGVAKGRISLERMTELLSANPARIFGMEHKGALEVGKDADLVVFDPRQDCTISRDKLHMNVDYSPFEGMAIKGMPRLVYARGLKVAQWNGTQMEFCGQKGRGRFIKRAPFNPVQL